MLLVCLALVVSQVCCFKNAGFFWHISDFHWIPNYDSDKGCRRSWPDPLKTPGLFGEYGCDSPWALIESAAEFMKNITKDDDIEFILWTGDSVSNSLNEEDKYEAIKNLTELLSRYFSSQFVFPVLGHTDLKDVNKLGQLWRHWLPTEALQTFLQDGYYTIEQKSRRLKVIVLNTNLWTSGEGYDPGGQWKWLEAQMESSRIKGKTVYLVGHVAPGFDERQGAPPRLTLAAHHNTRYTNMVRKYSDVLTGQFFGHLHSDTFRIVYDINDGPASVIYLSPSVTPRRTSSGANNPGVRLYSFDMDTGQISNYYQYFLDLPKANEAGEAIWALEYNFTRYYDLDEVSPTELNSIVQSFITQEGAEVFERYWSANSVGASDLPSGRGWTNAHFCAITQVDLADHTDCVSTRASALQILNEDQTPSSGSAERIDDGSIATYALLIGVSVTTLSLNVR